MRNTLSQKRELKYTGYMNKNLRDGNYEKSEISSEKNEDIMTSRVENSFVERVNLDISESGKVGAMQ